MPRSLSFRQRLASSPLRRSKKLFKSTAPSRLPSQDLHSGPDAEGAAQLPQSRRRHRTSLKRWFVLLWKRISQPNRPRQSGRFSFVPPGFAFVSIISMPRKLKRDSREIRRARRFGVFFEETPFSLRGLSVKTRILDTLSTIHVSLQAHERQ
ncbi:hypothetical protein F5146DRAFT_697079 [Armillaria mellea]|nr:hypothetical protein F5146DRAFT_697079 [Armillaria mellea]